MWNIYQSEKQFWPYFSIGTEQCALPETLHRRSSRMKKCSNRASEENYTRVLSSDIKSFSICLIAFDFLAYSHHRPKLHRCLGKTIDAVEAYLRVSQHLGLYFKLPLIVTEFPIENLILSVTLFLIGVGHGFAHNTRKSSSDPCRLTYRTSSTPISTRTEHRHTNTHIVPLSSQRVQGSDWKGNRRDKPAEIIISSSFLRRGRKKGKSLFRMCFRMPRNAGKSVQQIACAAE